MIDVAGLMELVEGKKAKTGEVRRWGDGYDYAKQGDGSWKRVEKHASNAAKASAPAGAPPPAPPPPAAEKSKLKIPDLKWTVTPSRNNDDDSDTQSAVKAPDGEVYSLHVGKGWEADGNTRSDKFRASVVNAKAGTLASKDGFATRKEAEDFAKDSALKAMLAKMPAATSMAINAKTPDEVKSALSGAKTRTGGSLKLNDSGPDFLSFEPQSRQRLDHYGTSYSDDGDEQEGWDSDGWETDYAGPLRREVEALLKSSGIEGWVVDVGEKGHVEVQLPKRSKAQEDIMDLGNIIDDARLLFVETDSVKYADDPTGYNTALAKMLGQLKKDKSTGVSGTQQGYKGGGKQAHRRQVWAKMPSHERGGPDIWLDDGFVKIGGIINLPKVIPNVKKYEGESPEAVYRWIADTMKALKKFTDEKYADSPAIDPKKNEETEMDIVTKLEALRMELEANEKPVGKAMPWPTKGPQSKPKAVSVPTVAEKLEALRIELEGLGEAHKPNAYRVGTVRTWKAGKFKKTATGWVPVTALLKKVANAPKGATASQDLKHAAFGKATSSTKEFIRTPGVVTYYPPKGTAKATPKATLSKGSTPGYTHQSKSSGHGAHATSTPSQSAAPASKPGGVMAHKSEHTAYSSHFDRLMGFSDERVLSESKKK